jgi:hypothetical protein
VVKELRRALAKAKASGVGVRLRARKIDLSGIPLAKVASVGRALTAARLPKAAP